MDRLTCPKCWGNMIYKETIYKMADGIGHRPLYRVKCKNCEYQVINSISINEAVKLWIRRKKEGDIK